MFEVLAMYYRCPQQKCQQTGVSMAASCPGYRRTRPDVEIQAGDFVSALCHCHVSVLTGRGRRQAGRSWRLGRVKRHRGQRGGDGGRAGVLLTWPSAQTTSCQ